MSSGLSDVLHDMAQRDEARPEHARHDDANDAFDGGEDDELVAELDEVEHDIAAAPSPADVPMTDAAPRQSPPPRDIAVPASSSQPAPRRPAPRPRRQDSGFKAVATPVMATIGLLLLLPAAWGTLILMGVEVWNSDREGATTMAQAMLICWPLSLAMLALSVLLFLQVRAERNAAPPARPRR